MCNCFSKNLGLGEGSALPVGVPIPWPSATPPTGWLKCNGAAFTASQYPKLALAYPALRLPDLRGEFIRGWDDGRGVDANRELLTSQSYAMQKIMGSLIDNRFNQNQGASGPFSLVTAGPADGSSTGTGFASRIDFDSSKVVNTASETRPRNVSFNYIVRAA
ncbi:TPA: phage tail protein [Salmonella enterica]